MAVRPAQGGGSPELGKRKDATEPPELGKKVKGGGGSSSSWYRIVLSLSSPSHSTAPWAVGKLTVPTGDRKIAAPEGTPQN
jgi:hypothetical protein